MRHRHLLTILGALGSLSLIVAACSSGDDDDSVTGDSSGPKTVAVRMVDNDFDPSALAVEKGDTVTFRFTNQGTIDHDAFVGTPEEQVEHESEMAHEADMADETSTSSSASSTSMPMGDGSDEPSGRAGEGGVVVPPGETGELTYTFDKAGVFEIGCHEPGHYDSGMKVHIEVEG